MFVSVHYTNLVKGETYYIRLSKSLGYIIIFESFSNFVCNLYNFKTKTVKTLVTPYNEPLFSKNEKYLRSVTKEEYMNKLNEIHQHNMTNKILQNLIDINFKYYNNV